jgi:hypothetical protein
LWLFEKIIKKESYSGQLVGDTITFTLVETTDFQYDNYPSSAKMHLIIEIRRFVTQVPVRIAV